MDLRIAWRAEQDLMRQYEWYLEPASHRIAERFLQAFDATVAKLTMHPLLGHPRRFRSPELAGLRSLPDGEKFGVHQIFYRSLARELSIEHVMQGA